MTLPKQVEEAGKKADEAAAKLEKELNGEKEVNPTKVENEPKPVVLVEPKTLEEAKSQLASLKSGVALIEHKFSVLQGKYDAEVKPASESGQRATQLETTNSVLTDQLIEAKAQIAELKAAVKPAAPAKPAAIKVDVNKYFSPEALTKLDNEGVTGEALEMIVNAVAGVTADQAKTQTANLVA
ncbi:MAG: hypothetical protein KAV87_24260, partial [Desulfobacteraceae bacterium]|nr:hypothetical protein [Desulfobacteraceae bacterium]